MFLEDGDFFLASPAVKHYFIYHSPFRLNYDKVIWKEIGIRKRGRVSVVFREFRQDVLHLCHNVTMACHQTIKHTKAILRECSFWKGMIRVLLVLVVLARKTNAHSAMPELRQPRTIWEHTWRECTLTSWDYFRLRNEKGNGY